MTYSKGVSTKLKIKSVCGAKVVSRQDGKKVNKLIMKNWENSQFIEVDFGNLEIASVSFLDEALGQLAMRFTRRELTGKLKLKGISERDKRLLNDILISRYRQRVKQAP
ncbi:MAG: hypothetical protein CO113_00270 [Elusimicrobia bacterium CG_4_9_14_3_um_filter_62_55]|nr:MAG: hypothetical protein COR54_08580 [Elusimicrobia bacterium CG22_combo_CG10-13_8_21_14_all_63_91]PJA14434.1 MAG: hypothetical protein COX66_12435 [Elusimicrobia bacterium CG_4_10_14_0_2_um_filter_63_34]PJB27100.1 MAG: hypothetical protein CO113_00270 [Elusimicrobia bacterium CG_4_9_14_3_um_filter_62_55]